MKNLNILDELRNRGFIFQISNIKDFQKLILKQYITLYCGFDPTSDSLHVGHLLPLLCLYWFRKFNHKILVLVGGATGLIGDPSFKNSERMLQKSDLIFTWSKNIQDQIRLFFDNINISSPLIVNNYNWFKDINLISFLRDIGKFFLVNKMINKKSVKNRINRLEKSISFTEFSYNLLQSYDFLELYKKYQVNLQIGGSDQWGNISSGIDLIRRIYQKQVFGLTIPLLTKSNGMKFGKTDEEKIIWLNSNKTSPYVFYQFWLNINDDQISDFLKLFTFLNISEIHEILENYNKENHYVFAKSILADQITTIVHGKKQLDSAKRITKNLFSGKINNLLELDFNQLKQDGIPSLFLNGTEDLKQALVLSKLSVSRNHAHKLIISHGVNINNIKEINPQYLFKDKDKLFGKYTLLSRGKKNHFLLCW